MKLTEEQAAAVARADQDLVLRAAAGSGKTFVLTEIVHRLITEFQVPPAEIVVVTFTEKAAHELKSRIARRLEKPLAFLEDCPIGTIHSFATRLLRSGADWLPRDFVIWDEHRAVLERSRIVHQEIENLLKSPSEELSELIAEYGWRTLVALMSSLLGARWKIRALAESKEEHPPLWSACCDLYQQLLNVFTEHKRRHGAVDFEDLEECALQLLERRGDRIAAKFRHILVDEYQDISPPQYQLIHQLHKPGTNRLVIVGDPLQSIYRFRGAEVALFEQTCQELRESSATEVELLNNFRSDAGLIESLNTVFQSVFGESYHPMRGIHKGSESPPLQVLALPKTRTLTERREAEAGQLVEHIKKMIQAGRPPEDFAILFRTRAAMSCYEDALEAEGIPYQSQQGNLLLEQQEVIDQINVFRALCHPEDTVARIGVMRSPLGGISDESLWAYHEAAESKALGTEWEDFQVWWDSLCIEAPHLKASEIAHRVWQRLVQRGYYKEGPERRHLKQWIAFLEWMEQIDPFELQDLLDVIEGFREDGARIAEVDADDEAATGVQLLTVHGAKGLEFPVVTVADLTAALPNPRGPILVDPACGVGMRSLDQEAKGLRDELMDTDAYLELKDFIREQEIAESRRLLYVACTRAQECLILALDRNRKETQPTWNKWLCEALPET